ncbi:MAG: DUF5058 family protein [Eubacteriales bacterium]|nr:DUF5058 family protein [Eubacteriales bacterium]
MVGLFVLISALGTVWSWWRLSVIGSLSYETMISGSVATALGFGSLTLGLFANTNTGKKTVKNHNYASDSNSFIMDYVEKGSY